MGKKTLAFQKPKLIWPALLVGLLSLLWLAQELEVIKSDIPAGPLALFCAALALLIYEFRK
ncbi:hypothetical protein COU37_00870 [Candidatus Micrarchaeota archaeon CG10_big_fil_rev_8_21_14_0_10_45_29]|nr:MAG: hypothetical protein COU37_00870 [Candidatus Micrarchaeota archaeon CG10_big_fil_rev_8_21_14_0_10_45_29]